MGGHLRSLNNKWQIFLVLARTTTQPTRGHNIEIVRFLAWYCLDPPRVAAVWWRDK